MVARPYRYCFMHAPIYAKCEEPGCSKDTDNICKYCYSHRLRSLDSTTSSMNNNKRSHDATEESLSATTMSNVNDNGHSSAPPVRRINTQKPRKERANKRVKCNPVPANELPTKSEIMSNDIDQPKMAAMLSASNQIMASNTSSPPMMEGMLMPRVEMRKSSELLPLSYSTMPGFASGTNTFIPPSGSIMSNQPNMQQQPQPQMQQQSYMQSQPSMLPMGYNSHQNHHFPRQDFSNNNQHMQSSYMINQPTNVNPMMNQSTVMNSMMSQQNTMNPMMNQPTTMNPMANHSAMMNPMMNQSITMNPMIQMQQSNLFNQQRSMQQMPSIPNLPTSMNPSYQGNSSSVMMQNNPMQWQGPSHMNMGSNLTRNPNNFNEIHDPSHYLLPRR